MIAKMFTRHRRVTVTTLNFDRAELPFATVSVRCDGSEFKMYVPTFEQAEAIAEGFLKAFPAPVAEAEE